MSRCRREPRKGESQPSNKEAQEHMETHIPYGPWCAHRIRGRERNDPPQVRRRKERTKGSSSPRNGLRIHQGEQP